MGGIGGDGAFPRERPPGGVVRVRVEKYEKLMGSMLEEAERRIAEADEARDRAVAEAESLRSALEASERRQASSARKFETWRAALVDAAADELCGGNQAVARRRRGEGRGDRGVDDQHAAAPAPAPRRTRGRPPARTVASRTNGRRSRLALDPRSATQKKKKKKKKKKRRSTARRTTPRRARAGTHKKKRDRSISAAPVAESPASLGDAARKAEASAKMRAATVRGETLERSGAVLSEKEGSGAGGSSMSTTSERKDERTETSFGFWPFW